MSDRADLQLLVTCGVVTSEINLLGHTTRHLSPRSKRNEPHHTELRATHICVELSAHAPPDDPVWASTWEEFIICDTLRQLPLSIL